jgi:hypothetical protein
MIIVCWGSLCLPSTWTLVALEKYWLLEWFGSCQPSGRIQLLEVSASVPGQAVEEELGSDFGTVAESAA